MSEKHTRTVKQVIVIRTDLNMRKGKMIAQGSHASMAFLTRKGEILIAHKKGNWRFYNGHLKNPVEIHQWLTEGFTKICLQCSSEQELEDLYNNALNAGLNAELIIDSGFTEFHGIPTKTCCSIGPDLSIEIDKITGHLKLL